MKTLKNSAVIIGLCFALSSCAIPVAYIGDKYPATDTVEVYYAAHDVKRDYKVIGHMSYQNAAFDEVKAKFQQYGKTVGADAIIIGSTQANKDNAQAVINADAIKYK